MKGNGIIRKTFSIDLLEVRSLVLEMKNVAGSTRPPIKPASFNSLCPRSQN